MAGEIERPLTDAELGHRQHLHRGWWRGAAPRGGNAHIQELKLEDSVTRGPNLGRIAECIEEANPALAHQTGFCWALSHEHRYQMAKRFCWAWKVTQLGCPVILVYLGFLRAEEIPNGREPFDSHDKWECLVKEHGGPLSPREVWDRQWVIHGQLVARINPPSSRQSGEYGDTGRRDGS